MHCFVDLEAFHVNTQHLLIWLPISGRFLLAAPVLIIPLCMLPARHRQQLMLHAMQRTSDTHTLHLVFLPPYQIQLLDSAGALTSTHNHRGSPVGGGCTSFEPDGLAQ